MADILNQCNVAYSEKSGRALATILTRGDNSSYGHVTISFTGDYWKGLSNETRLLALKTLGSFKGMEYTIVNPRINGTSVYFKSPELAKVRQALIDGPLKGVPNAREADRDPEMDDFHTQVVDRDHIHMLQERANRSGILVNGSKFTFCPATGLKDREILLKTRNSQPRHMRGAGAPVQQGQ